MTQPHLSVGDDWIYQAGVHLQRTGETMAPSFLRAAMALSTTLRSSPVSSAILPALTGSPALRMASNTIFFSSIIYFINLIRSRPPLSNRLLYELFQHTLSVISLPRSRHPRGRCWASGRRWAVRLHRAERQLHSERCRCPERLPGRRRLRP